MSSTRLDSADLGDDAFSDEVDGKIGCNWLYECLLIHLDYGFRSAPSYVGEGAPLRCTGDNQYPECGYSVLENISPFVFDFTCTLCWPARPHSSAD